MIDKVYIPLCWNTRTLAPESLAPHTIEAWFRVSLIINVPYYVYIYIYYISFELNEVKYNPSRMICFTFPPQMAGIVVELVAYPIANTIASGLPTKSAIVLSNSLIIE